MTTMLRSLALSFACPVCFRVEDGATAAGVRAAVIVLMTVTVVVLSGFGVFIAKWRARAARAAKGTEPFSTDLAVLGTEVSRRPDQLTSVPKTARSVEKGSVPLEPGSAT